jgi:hypothetical protein
MLLAPRNPRTAVPLTVIVLAASARATAPANKQIKIDLDNYGKRKCATKGVPTLIPANQPTVEE